MMAKEKGFILFDDHCRLCSFTVRVVMRFDRNRVFRFASLQSEAAKTLLQGMDLSGLSADSVMLLVGKQVYTASSAVLKVLSLLGYPLKALSVFQIIPRTLRDRIYYFVARYRYLVFPKRNQCFIPDSDMGSRFLA